MAPRIIGRLIGLLALLAAGLLPTVASAATLYITEYSNIGAIGSSPTPWPPGPAVTTQTVAVGGGSVQSTAFGTTTKAVGVICDTGCSVSFGTNPTATTSTTLQQQGVTYSYVVAPGQKVAVIANSAGNSSVGTVTLGAGSAIIGNVRIDQTTPGTTNGVQVNAALPAGANLIGSVTPGPYSYSRVTADGQVKATAGSLHTITISPTGTVTAGVVTIYDSATESGTQVLSIALPITSFTPFSVTLDTTMGTGIFVGFDATLANVQVTSSFR